MFNMAAHRSGNKGFVLIIFLAVLLVVAVGFGIFSMMEITENIRETQQAVEKVNQEAQRAVESIRREAQRAQEIATQANNQTAVYKDTLIETIVTFGAIALALFLLGQIVVKFVKICKRG